ANRINRQVVFDSFPDNALGRVGVSKALDTVKDRRMMRYHQVASLSNSFIQNSFGAIEADNHTIHDGVQTSNQEAAVIVRFLQVRRGNRLQQLDDIIHTGFHAVHVVVVKFGFTLTSVVSTPSGVRGYFPRWRLRIVFSSLVVLKPSTKGITSTLPPHSSISSAPTMVSGE